jgi:PAS domain S-box-containing protein
MPASCSLNGHLEVGVYPMHGRRAVRANFQGGVGVDTYLSDRGLRNATCTGETMVKPETHVASLRASGAQRGEYAASSRGGNGSVGREISPRQGSEDEVRRSEEHLRAIVENTPECIKVIACDGTIVSMNRAGLRLVEAQSAGDVVGRCVFELVAPEFREAFRELHGKVCGGEKSELEYEIIGLKGSRRWMRTHGAPIRHPVTGEPAHLGITRDITEQRQAERAVRLSEERLRLATSSEAITLYEQDAELRYTWLYPPKPLFAHSLGRRDGEILPNEEGAFLERVKKEVMRTGQSQRHVVSATFQSRKTYYDLLISPRLSSDGQIIGVAGSALDITDRKNAEEALRTSELRWRNLTQALPNLVWTDLADGQCDWLSPQWGTYTGIPEKELLGLAWLDRVIHPEDRERTLRCWENACADKAPYDLEYRIRRHDGEYHWFKTRGVPVRDAHGKIVYWFGTCTDIQDLKEAEADLAFLGELSAALTNPETAVEIATSAARLLCRHFGASRVNFSDIDLRAGEATVFASGREPELKEDRITHRLGEYLPESILTELQAGRVVAIDDIRTDPRTAPLADNFAQWSIGSMILSPHLTGGYWRFLAVVHKGEAHRWRPEELRLVPEITARVHNRIERARALQAVRESEGRLRELIEALPAAVYTTDAEGRITMFNQAAVKFSGRVPQIGSDSWCVSWKLYHPDGRPMAHDQCPMAIAVREGRAVRGTEAIAERPDGTRINFIPYPTPLRDRDGKIVGAINMLVDISARKRAEEQLAADADALARLNALGSQLWRATNLQEGMGEMLDATIGMLGADMGNVQLLEGGTLRIAAQRGFREDFLEFFREVSADDDSACGRALRTGERIIIADVEADEAYAPMRAIARAAGCRAVQSTPLIGRDGKPRGIISTHWRSPYLPDARQLRYLELYVRQASDFIERWEIEAEQKQAQESAARLAAIVEHSDDAIFSADVEGIIRSWNRGAERLYGYSAAEAIGQHIDVLVPGGYGDEQPRILDLIRRGQTVENYETSRRRKDGSVFRVSLTVSPVKDASGRIIGVSKVARDITEKVRARQILEETVAERTASLEQALAQMEDFTYSVSHDLRAPARAIRGIAEAAIEDYGNTMPAEVLGFIQRMSASAQRMEQLIRDILDYSRVSRAEVKVAAVDLDELVQGIIRERPEMQPARARIDIRAPLGAVLGHETSLSQAVTNLLANAVKFVPPGTVPEVRLWTERANGFVRLWVRDNGIGVKPQYQDRIFNVFERAHDSTLYEGTGIGLAIVRRAAEKMGGKVGLVSDGVSGSSFWIELPAASA